ncbi:MAG: hypothetical protein PHU88_04675 [candidate division Zixibacteria bacterium]|nr:hypothetical protein [candidate division Zixibacteria bacterium]MDD5425172.1 hypothetical protein [candidate division Zixibacteria bacterium]
MIHPVKFLWIGIITLALVVFSYDHAQAYIDPSTGSYILQLLLAGILGALFTLKLYWRRIKAAFAQLFSKKQSSRET